MAGSGTDGDEPDRARSALLRAELQGLALSIPAMLGVVRLFGASRNVASWEEIAEFLRGAPIQLAGGFGAMLLAVLLGLPGLAPHCARQPWLLAPWTVFVFALGSAFGCTLNWLVLGGVDHDAYLVKPLLVLLTYGCLPAFLLGCVVVLLFVGARRR
ncbi:MAG: hypothetical protein ACK501_16730 [Planctomycetota bacterium]